MTGGNAQASMSASDTASATKASGKRQTTLASQRLAQLRRWTKSTFTADNGKLVVYSFAFILVVYCIATGLFTGMLEAALAIRGDQYLTAWHSRLRPDDVPAYGETYPWRVIANLPPISG